MNTITRALHDATHWVPGVPEHREQSGPAQPRPSGPRLQNRGLPNRGLQHRNPHHRHDTPPRVLVAWQERIARLVHAARS